MKIKQINVKNNKLLKLQLLNIKSFKKLYFFKALKIEDIEYRLIKLLKIVHKYNNTNKIIFFISNYLTIEAKLRFLLKKTNHFYFSSYCYWNNTVTNFSLSNKLQKNIGYSTILKNKNDLKIIFNKKKNNLPLKKSYDVKIPSVFLNNDELTNSTMKSSYKILGNFFHKNNQFFFILILLNCVFKKSRQTKYIKLLPK